MKNEMISISKSDLAILLETAIMLRDHLEYQDYPEIYNIIKDGSLDSETFDETGEYSDEENKIMEDVVDNYVSSLNGVIRTIIK
jgi:hypothetical protein